MTISVLESLWRNREKLNERLQRKYSSLAEMAFTTEIIGLASETGIVPQLSDQGISTLYFTSAREYVSDAVEELKQLKEWDTRAHEGRPTVFEGLDVTHFTKAIQEGYYRTIRDNPDLSMKRGLFIELAELTGIAVSKKTVQRAINEHTETEYPLEDRYLEIVEEVTGTNPVYDNNVVQRKYRNKLMPFGQLR